MKNNYQYASFKICFKCKLQYNKQIATYHWYWIFPSRVIMVEIKRKWKQSYTYHTYMYGFSFPWGHGHLTKLLHILKNWDEIFDALGFPAYLNVILYFINAVVAQIQQI